MGQVAKNLEIINDQIAKAAREAGRSPDDVQLVAVSKVQPEARIDEALAAGQRVFGENRVQEAQVRWQERCLVYPDIQLHLIGPLQTNKVKDAVALFDVIETVDREKLAQALAKEMAKQEDMNKKNLPCFIQVNTGEEEQKAGIVPADLENFYRFCVEACGLNIVGLMCIPPVDEPAALHFALLKKYADSLGLSQLSMGMSADFEKAIALGATYVRVGTGVFGERLVC
ncbi:MAG: YggS family pyridoxal phosphate-dependent enzyme [Alphaproteobacteria bacterium]|nr:YggS family pyridoxal phosphate-dependent enzyme [Alphaproteobacteria bacterium]